MTRAIGRRPDQSADEQTQQYGPEKWAVVAFAVLLLLAIVGLLALAA